MELRFPVTRPGWYSDVMLTGLILLKKALGGGAENQSHLVTPQAHPALGPVDINGLEDSTLNKVGKLSPEQRKEKIRRYMKKRNERNFNKKIKVRFLLNQTGLNRC